MNRDAHVAAQDRLPECVERWPECESGAAKWCVGCGAPLVDVRCSNILCRNFDGPSAAQPQRDPACVERWPECESGAYDPRCCRFPKSCSCNVPDESPAARGRGLIDRPWLQRRIRFENRLAWRLGKIARALHADTHRLTRQAVVDFHKSKGTWPQPDHIYPEMRGERDAH